MANNQIQLQNAPVLARPANICDLDIDCFEELVDWLPLVDLHSVGQTCKRFQQYAGFVFRQTFPGAYVEFKNGGIFIGDVPVNGFCDFIENLSVREDELEYFHFIKSNNFKSLKRIEFHNISFTDEKLACIKHILKKGEAQESAVVDDIQLFECTIGGEFYDKFLQHCINMKRFTLKKFDFPEPEEAGTYGYNDNKQPLIGIDNSWMLRKYPKLEYFGLGRFLSFRDQTKKLSKFFHQNSNIRKFAFDTSYLSVSEVASFGLELDDMAIICDDFEADMYYYLLKSLSGQTFFKRLQLYDAHLPVDLRPIDPADRLDPMEGIGALDKYYEPSVDIRSLTGIATLTTLCIGRIYRNKEDISTLTQLEKVSIENAKTMELEAFVIHLPKLNTITVKEIDDVNVSINLSKWNRERQRLVGACKVTVYVDEALYLAVKWATNETNHKLVQLKRLDSFDWNHDLGYPDGRY